MGICHAETEGRTAVHSISRWSLAAHDGSQLAESREHSMSVCHSGPEGFTVVHSIGRCSLAAHDGSQLTESRDHSMVGRTAVPSMGCCSLAAYDGSRFTESRRTQEDDTGRLQHREERLPCWPDSCRSIVKSLSDDNLVRHLADCVLMSPLGTLAHRPLGSFLCCRCAHKMVLLFVI